MEHKGSVETSDNVSAFIVVELKKYLSAHGEPVSGNKRELVERVKGCKRLGKSDFCALSDEDKQASLLRTNDKLATPQGESLPHPKKLCDWITDFTKIPDFTEKEIYNYFVLKMNAQRQLKSKVFYEDRHVHSVEMHSLNENTSNCYVLCKVLPSMPTAKKNDTSDYTVWVMLSKVTGCINSAECNCVAGDGEACNHISALLYAVSEISKKKSNGLLAPTSMTCKWNNPRKRKLSPKRAQYILFRKQMWGKECAVSEPFEKVENEIESSVNVDRFRNRLLENKSKAGWLKNFKNSDSAQSIKLPQLHHMNYQFQNSVTITNPDCISTFNDYFLSLSVSQADCETIECLTRDQSRCSDWATARHERITASNFGSVCRRHDNTPPESMLKTLLGYRTFHSVFTDYGHKHESAARQSYIKLMRKCHPGIVVRQSGLIVSTDYPHLGASPDGLVYCTHCCESRGLLEIKCPASFEWRMGKPTECAQDSQFF